MLVRFWYCSAHHGNGIFTEKGHYLVCNKCGALVVYSLSEGKRDSAEIIEEG